MRGWQAAALVLVAASLPVKAGPFFFDMGTVSSPVKPGYRSVTAETVYTPQRGYGWDRPAQGSFDDNRPVPEELRATHPNHVGPVDDPALRDGVEDDQAITFIADVPPGRYWVCAVVGRYAQPRHDLSVAVNGKVIATNVDAWGHVWGSQGGSPTRSVAVVAGPKDGQFRITFDYVRPTADRWKEYTDRRPEGGNLWYLGPNRSSIVAIRIRPWMDSPLRLAKGRVVGEVRSPALAAAIAEFNAGRVDAALAGVLAFSPGSVDEQVEKAACIDCMAGSLALEDRAREIALMAESMRLWQAVLDGVDAAGQERDPRALLAAVRLESAQRYRQALEYLGMYAYAWANRKTGLNAYHRYWAASDLCDAVTPEDPLYWKSLLLRGRVANWTGREGGWKHCYDLAAGHFALLKREWPDNPLVTMYTGGRVPSRLVYTAPEAPGAPAWAKLQHEAMFRYMELIRYWIRHRQSDNGELGGGWGDDVEILRGWAPAVLAVGDAEARAGVRRLAEGVWHSGDVENGYARKIEDVEHGAELVSDTQPLMCAVEYGDPIYIERCMQTLACMRDIWTAVNARGHRHFKAHFFSATEVSRSAPQTADVALNARAANPGIWVMWYSAHPEALRLLGEWCSAWVEDASREENGKPRGFVPPSVRFEDDRIGGFSDNWWETRGYFTDFEAVGYTATLYDTMLAMYAATERDHFFSSVRSTADAVLAERQKPSAQAPPGSTAWAARVSDCQDLADVLAKWRRLSGGQAYDALLRTRGSAYTRYLVDGDENVLLDSLRQVIDGLSSNIEMSTSEVLFTDRVSLPGAEILFEMMTGSVGTPTYYPLHAVTWERTQNQLAALVDSESDSRRLVVQLYSFADAELPVRLRLWRLEPGEYQLRLSSGTGSAAVRIIQLQERGSAVDLPIPPNRLLRLELRQLRPAPRPAGPLPDLAIGSDAIELLDPPAAGKSGRVRLTLHNIGLEAVAGVDGILHDGQQPVAEVRWMAIDPPLDLRPRVAQVEVSWTPSAAGEHALRLAIDPHNRIPEIAESNNRRETVVHVSH